MKNWTIALIANSEAERNCTNSEYTTQVRNKKIKRDEKKSELATSRDQRMCASSTVQQPTGFWSGLLNTIVHAVGGVTDTNSKIAEEREKESKNKKKQRIKCKGR